MKNISRNELYYKGDEISIYPFYHRQNKGKKQEAFYLSYLDEKVLHGLTLFFISITQN